MSVVRAARIGIRSGLAVAASMLVVFGASWPSSAGAESPNPDVVVVGDSLTGDNAARIGDRLRSTVPHTVQLEGLGGRRIEESYEWLGWRSSGLEAIERVRAAGIEPELWVIELGTNDLFHFGDRSWAEKVAESRRLIDTVVAAVGPESSIAWVTVLNRDDAVATRTFNEALRGRAAANERLALIDWEHTSTVHPEWFIDLVHPNDAGADVLADIYGAEIERRLAAH
ncbi:MAG: SGNH/GDSL hydrolase family protein [Ilumatobacteraceae bacterium]